MGGRIALGSSVMIFFIHTNLDLVSNLLDHHIVRGSFSEQSLCSLSLAGSSYCRDIIYVHLVS